MVSLVTTIYCFINSIVTRLREKLEFFIFKIYIIKYYLLDRHTQMLFRYVKKS